MNDRFEHENIVYIKGNIGNDIIINTTKTGIKVCNLRIATHKYITNKDKVKDKLITWNTVVAWGYLTDICNTFKTGDLLRIIGEVVSRKGKDGNFTSEIKAKEIYLIYSKG